MIEVVLGIIAVGVAVRQLVLQRDEIRRNGQITSLVHVASMIQHRIDYYEKIIHDLRGSHKGKNSWRGHQVRVNSELRPLLADVHRQLVGLMAKQNMPLSEVQILKALSITSAADSSGKEHQE